MCPIFRHDSISSVLARPLPVLPRGGQVGKREILNGLKEKQTTVFNYIQNFAGKLWAGSRDYTRR